MKPTGSTLRSPGSTSRRTVAEGRPSTSGIWRYRPYITIETSTRLTSSTPQPRWCLSEVIRLRMTSELTPQRCLLWAIPLRVSSTLQSRWCLWGVIPLLITSVHLSWLYVCSLILSVIVTLRWGPLDVRTLMLSTLNNAPDVGLFGIPSRRVSEPPGRRRSHTSLPPCTWVFLIRVRSSKSSKTEQPKTWIHPWQWGKKNG